MRSVGCRGVAPLAVVVALGCAGPERGPPSPGASQPSTSRPAAADASVVNEIVRVVNPTKYAVTVEVVAESGGRAPATVRFPVAAGGRGEGRLDVWKDGKITFTASWDVEGKPQRSRPFTAVLSPSEPVTPVTLTLQIPHASGTLGTWSAVEWDPPGAPR